MTALGADSQRKVKDWQGGGSYPVLAATQIWKGALVCVDANGYAIPATDTAAIYCVGVATENVLGGASSGDKWVKVEAGRAYLFAASSITQAMVGEPMYVVDDNTVDETSTNLCLAGVLVQFVSTTSGWVLVAPSYSLALSGVTSSAGELNYLDITAAGTVQASKAVVVDGSKNIATFGTLGSAAITVTSNSATSLAVGRLGATTPAFTVDSSTGSQVAGLKVTGAATGGTVAVVATDSGADASLTVNAKGAGTIGIGSVSTGAVTITPATTVTGALTPSGGVNAVNATTRAVAVAGLGVRTCGIPAVASTDGTDTSNTNTEAYIGAVTVPCNCSTTGVSVFNGTAVAGNLTIYLFNANGTAAVAATASTAQSGTDAYQRIAWAGGPIALTGPATYYIVWTGDTTGATQKVNLIPFGEGPAWKETGLTYGTVASITPVTTFTANRAPYATLY